MGEPQTPHFYDFGIFGRVPGYQNQLCLSLEAPGHLKKPRKVTGTFQNNTFVNLKMSDIYNFENRWKRRAPTDPKDPSYKFLQISNMGSISSRKHEMNIC